MRKFSLFLIVAIIATMFTFIATPVSAAGESITYTYTNAPQGAAYDYIVTTKLNVDIHTTLYTLAIPRADFLLVDSDGVALTPDDVQTTISLNGITSLSDKRMWLVNGLTFGSSAGNFATTSTVVATRRSGAIYDVAKVSFNSGSGTSTAAFAGGDLIKFYLKKVGTSTNPAASIKIVSTTGQVSPTFGINTTTLNTGLSSSATPFGQKPYSSIQYGACVNGVKLGSAGVNTADITIDKVAWVDSVVTANNKITATVGAHGSVSINGTAYTAPVALGAATTATIAITPDSGYEIDTATFDGADIKSAIVGGTYNATGITATSALVVTFKQIVIPDNIITASITGNGKVRINDGFVVNGGQVNLGTGTSAKIVVVPAFGYEVASATFNGVSMGLDKDGGVYTATVSGTKALVVTFAARTEVVKPQILHEVFKEIGKTKNRQGEFNKEVTTFAKKPATATEYGVELKNSLGEGVTIPSGEGPKFKATAGTSATGQYGINFIGLPSGTYTATPYAIVEGVTYYGTAVTFVAE